MLKELPSTGVIMNVVSGSNDKVTSQFRITYAMILSIMRVQDMSLEGMISHSFSEAVHQREIDSVGTSHDDVAENLYPIAYIQAVSDLVIRTLHVAFTPLSKYNGWIV